MKEMNIDEILYQEFVKIGDMPKDIENFIKNVNCKMNKKSKNY